MVPIPKSLPLSRFDPHHAWIRKPHTPLLAASQRYFTALRCPHRAPWWKTPRKLGPVVKEEGKRYPGYCLVQHDPSTQERPYQWHSPLVSLSLQPASAWTLPCRHGPTRSLGLVAGTLHSGIEPGCGLAGSQLVIKSCLGWRKISS